MSLYIYWSHFWGPETGTTYDEDHQVWWLTSNHYRIVCSSTSHWLSGSKESHVPSHRHQRVPDHWDRDSKEARIHTLSKVYPTQVNTTAKDTCTPEGNKDEDIKTGDSKWGPMSEMFEGPAVGWCGTHKWEETQITQSWKSMYWKNMVMFLME